MGTATIGWRVGVEVELLAPLGSDRRALAHALANDCGGTVAMFLHPDAEPAAVDGTPLFHNLTFGFSVLDARGQLVAKVVDDITLQADLDMQVAPKTGWWRVVSDDRRLTELATTYVKADEPLPDALEPIAELFGVVPESGPDGMWRVASVGGLPIVIAVPMPGERERAAELVTAPISEDHESVLAAMLSTAVDAGFVAPTEGATHVHFDAGPLRSARTFRRFVQLLAPLRESIRSLLVTNPSCQRLAPWPHTLLEAVAASDWDGLSWDDVTARLSDVVITKYCDINILNVLAPPPGKDTVEFRMLPVHLDVAPILGAIRLFGACIDFAGGDAPLPHSSEIREVLEHIGVT